MNRKVAVNIISRSGYGGVQKVAYDISCALESLGFCVDVIIVEDFFDIKFSSKIEKWLHVRKKVSSLLMRLDPDIVIIHNSSISFLLPVKLFKKTVRVVHRPIIFKGQRVAGIIRSSVLTYFSFFCSRNIVCVSRGLVEQVAFIFKKKTDVIYNGQSDDFYKNNDNYEFFSYLKDFEGIRLVHFGRLCFQKNQEFSIKIISEMKDLGVKVQLVIIGSGERYQSLIDVCRENNLKSAFFNVPASSEYDVIFVPPMKGLSWMPEYFDYAIFPSRFEGLNISIIEACSVGLPVVSSDCKYGPREIKEKLCDFLNGGLSELLELLPESVESSSDAKLWANKLSRKPVRIYGEAFNLSCFMDKKSMQDAWRYFIKEKFM